MKEVGKLQKYDGPFLECLIRRSDTYNDVVERGALVLGLHVKTQKTMCLFNSLHAVSHYSGYYVIIPLRHKPL